MLKKLRRKHMKNLSRMAELIWKSAVGGTGSVDLAGGLATDLGGQVLLSLEGEGIFDTIKASAPRAAFHTRISLGGALVAEITGEGLKIPVAKYALDRAGLVPLKVAGIAVGDNTALKTLEGAALIASELRQAVIAATDRAFLALLADGAGTTEVATADVLGDLKKMLDAVPGSNPKFWLMYEAVLNFLRTLRAGPGGPLLFQDLSSTGGALLGDQVLVAAGQGDFLQRIDSRGFVVGAEDLTVRTSVEAMLEMDSEPEDSGSEGIIISAFQADATALIGIRSFAARVVRPSAVGVLTGLSVAWGIGESESGS
jgi:HK97 family phage major capsid protein